MTYVSLYRKYRSQTFQEIIGQPHVTKTLANAIKTDRITHAYLFCGPRGTGKTSTAKVLAKSLNCEQGPTAEPCGKCGPCTSIRAGSSMDVIEIDAASNRGIDEIRALRETVQYAPVESRYKVYVVDEVHMLTTEAFNALLRTLEEPPKQVIFVLCTTEPHRLPATILSRCQRFDFHRVPAPDIQARLEYVIKQEKFKVEPEAIALIVRAADGSMRDALSLLDQALAYAESKLTAQDVHTILGGIDTELLNRVAEVIVQHDTKGAFELIDQVVNEGKDLRQLAIELVGHFRDLMLMGGVQDGEKLVSVPPSALAKMREHARVFSGQQALQAITAFSETEREMRWSAQQRLNLEVCLAKLCAPALSAPAPQPSAPTPSASSGQARKPQPTTVRERPSRLESPSEPEPVTASTSEPIAESTTPPETVDLNAIQQRWETVLGRLKKDKQFGLHACLTNATPVRFDSGVLTLSFAHPFHHEKSKAGREPLRDILAQVMGQTIVVECELLGQEAPLPAGPEVQEIPETKHDPADAILKLFPGSEVVK